MKKDSSKDRTLVRYRRLLICLFLIVLLLMYLTAKVEIRKKSAVLAAAQAHTEDNSGAENRTSDSSESPVNEQGADTGNDTDVSERIDRSERTDSEAGTDNAMESQGLEEFISEEPSKDDKPRVSESTSSSKDKDKSKNKSKNKSKDAKLDTKPDVEFQIEEEDMWSLYLTNAEYPIPEDYQITTVSIPGTTQLIDSRVLDPLLQMLEAAKAEGLWPIVCSGYRTLEKQESLFQNKIQRLQAQGKTEEEACNLAKRVISVPGSGEHCMGLAVDIYSADYSALEEGFGDTPEGKWLRAHSQEYGFILRYDKGKEEITGIDYEPWHFRYVGVKAAKYLTEQGLCLEEFYIQEGLFG